MAKPVEHDDIGVVTKTRAEKKLARPPPWKVLLHNDDYTTREFVVFVLQSVDRLPASEM